MRTFLVVLFGITLTASLASAQNKAQVQQQRDEARETSTWPSTPYEQQDFFGEDTDQQDGTCYTMRTYLFARRDAEPPQLVATFTCTPRRQRDMKGASVELKRLVER
jgi:hypothetical protein